jgi:hypothetical protein
MIDGWMEWWINRWKVCSNRYNCLSIHLRASLRWRHRSHQRVVWFWRSSPLRRRKSSAATTVACYVSYSYDGWTLSMMYALAASDHYDVIAPHTCCPAVIASMVRLSEHARQDLSPSIHSFIYPFAHVVWSDCLNVYMHAWWKCSAVKCLLTIEIH